MDGTITAIEPQERRGGKRVNIFLDGAYAFSLDAEVAVGLKIGDRLDQQTAVHVLERDQVQVALDTALAFLGHRPRSEQEIRRRLARKELPPSVVEKVLERLRHWKLVDDHAFAQYWVDQRRTHRPRGARLLKLELRQRGVEGEVAANVVDEGDDAAADDAYRAAEKKARQMAGLDERTFRTRLGQFLARRGFDWDTVKPTVDRLWEAVGAAS